MEVLKLSREFMKSPRKLTDYNFREFFLRKAREDFRSPNFSLEKARNELEVIQRQAIIQGLFAKQKSIMETIGREEKLGRRKHIK